MSEQDQNSPENRQDSEEENKYTQQDNPGGGFGPDNVQGAADENTEAEGLSSGEHPAPDALEDSPGFEEMSTAEELSESHDGEEHVPSSEPIPAEEAVSKPEENSEPARVDGAAEETEEQPEVIEKAAESSLEGVEEITAPDEVEGSEESLRREEVVDDLAHIIESIVFASDEPLPIGTVKSVLDAARTFGRIHQDMIVGRINALNAKYEEDGSGFYIVEIANGYQYATRKEMAQWVSNLFKERSKRRLSNSALETVAIIAYKQPITKPEIESIRGVSVDYVLHNLLEKELVTVVGRAETVGRPLLYGTTQKFLKIFALKNLEDLPKLREIDEIIKEIKSKGAEESIQLEITALGDSSAPEPTADSESKPGERSENGTE